MMIDGARNRGMPSAAIALRVLEGASATVRGPTISRELQSAASAKASARADTGGSIGEAFRIGKRNVLSLALDQLHMH